MAQEMHINLIKEFSEDQKDNDYIILTSFCFDPYFFDKYLFHKIRANNPESEVLVLIDGEQYTKSLEKFTNETGRNYHLIPIYINRGVFHPKIALFVSKRRKEVTIYVASSNLTLPGFTRNAEIVTKIQYDSNYLDKNAHSIKDFFMSLINKKYIRDEKSIIMLNQALDSFPIGNEINENIEYEFIHNIDNPILAEMMKLVNSSFSYEAILLAPFFAPDESIIKEMMRYININKIVIALPKNRHNLVDPSQYISYFNQNNINYNFYEATFSADDSRIFHSKLIYLKNKMHYLLVGSPNITRAALLRNGEKGNIECAILFKGKNAESLIENINLVEIKDWDVLTDLEIDEDILDSSPKNLKIYSAEFNDIERSLRLIIEPVEGDLSVCIMRDNEKEPLNKYIPYLNGDELKFKIPGGIPNEVIISSKEKSARFRVYYDRNYFFRNLPRNKESFKQITDRLSNDFTIDLSDIHAMIIGLARRNQEFKENINLDDDIKSNEKGRNREPLMKPGKIHQSSSIISHIHKMNRLYQALCFNIKQRRDYQDPNLDENEGDSHEEIPVELSRDRSDKLDIDLDKFINFVDNILIQSVYLSEEKNKNNIIVQCQSIFIDAILKGYHIALKEQHFEHVEKILKNNLSKIDRKEISKDSSIKLFKRLLSINYCYNQMIHTQFMSDIFLYSDLINSDAYYCVKEYIINHQRNYCTNESIFLLKDFQDHFCSLMTFVFSPSDIGQGSVDLVQAMIKTEDQEFIDFIGMILIKLKYGPWGQKKGCGRFSLLTPRKKIEAMKYDLSIFSPKQLEYLTDFLTESMQRDRITHSQ